MPTVSLWLGSYVTTRPRGDGTFRVLFEVPKRLRPLDWPSQIPLPREGFRRGDGRTVGNLDDLFEVTRIRADADALAAALKASRKPEAGKTAVAAAVTRKGSIPWLIMRWGGQRLLDAAQGHLTARVVAIEPGAKRAANNPLGASDSWIKIRPRSRKLYVASLRHVFAWSVTQGHKPVRSILTTDLANDDETGFLDHWNGAPGQCKNIRDALSQLFNVATRAGEMTKQSNPLASIVAPKRERVKGGRRAKVERWGRDAVATYAETARTVAAWRPHNAGRNAKAQRPWAGGARMVRLMYETSQDSTDVSTWNRRDNLRRIKGVDWVCFDRGKTGQQAQIPISADLAREIRESGDFFFVVDPMGRPYEPVVDDSRLRGHLVTLREKVVVHLSAHADKDTNKDFYLQRSADKALEIQKARGLL